MPAKGAALRLMALVLTWALVLLPLSLGGPSLDQRDWRDGPVVADVGNVQALLSSYDRSQSALRSSETKHSGKSTGGWGKVALATGGQQSLEHPGQPVLTSPRLAEASGERFQAFSARAPPLG